MILRTVLLGIVLFFLVLVAAMIGATYLPSYQDCESYGSEYDANANQDNAHRFVPKPPVTNNTLWDCEGYVADRNGNTITAVATVLLTVVTLLLSFIAYLQFAAARNQARPYVFALAKGIEHWATGEPLKIKVLLENVGVTPAYDVEWAGIASIEAVPPYRPRKWFRRERFMQMPKVNIPHSVSPLAKEAIWDVFTLEASEFGPEILDALRNGNLCVCVYSYAQHRDIFEGRHIVESCHYIGPEDMQQMVGELLSGQTVTTSHMQVRHAPYFNRMT